ncbi:hypothetical protein BVY03_03380 [bacterium K02(2017)]|nr:hypothetical protein BVY03_03380 [bacterium K02(2017)]
MIISEYLKEINSDNFSQDKDEEIQIYQKRQSEWNHNLKKTVQKGHLIYEQASTEKRNQFQDLFNKWVRTEELKAWYGSPEGESVFQGTSISSLTIPAIYEEPLKIKSIQHLEELICDAYIERHDKYESIVQDAIIENVDQWMSHGLFYGFVLPSKMLSQAFNLSMPWDEVIFEVDGKLVDPHEILSYPLEIREKYFEICKKKINCFEGLELTQSEFEECLILADISKPKIKNYSGKLLLAPVQCNKICTLISRHVTKLIREKTKNRISPPSLMVTIYDTDTPYSYHRIGGHLGNPVAPVLPGLVVQGCSGSIDAFRWLYAYRVSLVSQMMMKGSLYSQVHNKFIPFIFFGVLVPRDADILLDMQNLGQLRYGGNLSPSIEFNYLLPKLNSFLENEDYNTVMDELQNRLV